MLRGQLRGAPPGLPPAPLSITGAGGRVPPGSPPAPLSIIGAGGRLDGASAAARKRRAALRRARGRWPTRDYLGGRGTREPYKERPGGSFLDRSKSAAKAVTKDE